jgi:hypothetical protein
MYEIYILSSALRSNPQIPNGVKVEIQRTNNDAPGVKPPTKTNKKTNPHYYSSTSQCLCQVCV